MTFENNSRVLSSFGSAFPKIRPCYKTENGNTVWNVVREDSQCELTLRGNQISANLQNDSQSSHPLLPANFRRVD